MKRLVLIALLATGCINGSKKPGLIAGGAISAIGLGMIASTNQQSCSSMPIDDAIGCGADELGTTMIGGYALLIGLGIMALTAVIPTPDDNSEP